MEKKLFLKNILVREKYLLMESGNIVIRGTIKSSDANPIVTYWAPNPPNYRTSYTGSALPYPNPSIAYENTPNKGKVRANNRRFEIRIKYPK